MERCSYAANSGAAAPAPGRSDRPSARVPEAAAAAPVRRGPGPIAGRDTPAPAGPPGAGAVRQPLGRRQLEVIAQGLDERDRRVLHGLGEHRFLTTRQIERWHGSRRPSRSAAARATGRLLERLRGQGLLRRLARRIGGVRAGSASYIWHLTAAGQRLLGLPPRRVREPSTAFLDHSLGVAEVRVRLVEAARRGRWDLVDAAPEPRCWRRFTGPYGAPAVLKPDLWAVLGIGAYEELWFVEYDRGTEHLPTLCRKAAVYEAYRRSGLEQRRSGAFPHVLWIAPDPERAAAIVRALGRTGLHRVTVLDRLEATITDTAAEAAP